MAKEHDGNDDGREPDERKVGDTDIRLTKTEHLQLRRKSQYGDRNDIRQKSERGDIPSYEKCSIHLTISKREEVNDRSGDARQDVEVSAFESHVVRHESVLC